MKKIFYALLVVFSINVHAQLQQFNEYSTGWLEYNTTLYNQDKDVIGYVLIYNKGLNDDKTKINQEYVLLDNNLNKITNGDFDLTNNKGFKYSLYEVKFNRDYLDIIYDIRKEKDPTFYGYLNTHIDIKLKKVLHKRRFNADSTTEELNFKDLVSKGRVFNNFGDCTSLDVVPSSGDTYFVAKTFKKCSLEPELTSVIIYNSAYEKLYQIGDKKLKGTHNLEFQLGQIKDNEIQFYVNHNRTSFGNIIEIFKEGFHTIDATMGNLKMSSGYNPQKGEYSIPSLEKVNNYLVTTGELKKSFQTAISTVRELDLLGIRRYVIDDNQKVIVDKNIYFSDLFKDLNQENKKYDYLLKKVYNYDDLSFTIIVKQENSSAFSLENNFIIADFSQDGQLIKSTLVKKNLSDYYEDYNLFFSQFDRESKEILFNFYDNEKTKEGSIRSIVFNKYKDGILTQEKKQIDTKLYKTKIYPAKYGYVLFLESDNKGKPLSQRLERSNL